MDPTTRLGQQAQEHYGEHAQDPESPAGVEALQLAKNAFSEVYMATYPVLLRNALRFTHGDEHRAQDVVQDAYERAIRKIESFKGSSEFQTWLYTLMKNSFLDALSSMDHRLNDLALHGDNEVMLDRADPNRLSDPLEAALEAEVLEEFEADLVQIPPGMAEAVRLQFSDFSIEAIAHALKVKEGTAKSQVKRGWDKIRELHGRRQTEDSP